MEPATPLRSLRDRPFELLAEMDRRARAVVAGQHGSAVPGTEWVGIGFRVGALQVLAAREDVREVLMCAPTTRVPGAKAWVTGLANIRGQLLPLIDFSAFLDSGPTVAGRLTRVLAVNHKKVPAGLIVDEVYGFRRFMDNEYGPAEPDRYEGIQEYLAGEFARGDEVWPVLNLRKLVESERFLNAAE